MFGPQAQPDQVQAERRRGQCHTQLRIPDTNTGQGYTYFTHHKQLTVTSCFSGTKWPNMPLTVWNRGEESVNRGANRTFAL